MTRQEYGFTDSRAMVRAAMSDLFTHGLSTLSNWLRRADYSDPRIIDRDDDNDYRQSNSVIDAAALLGVRVGASADDVRAAFRRAIKAEMATDSGFHDHGGDSTDPRALELIAAKNLLLEHSRQEVGHAFAV